MERQTPAGRRVRIPDYAQRRLAQRGIGVEEVMRVLADPTTVEPSRDAPERWVERRTVRGRRLVVVTEREGVRPGVIVVVTAWIAE